MALSVGIVGLPNVGKSTLFNALSSKQAEAANYAFCTIDPNVGVVPVPDPRFDALVELFSPDKVVPATIEFVDIAGLVRGASKGEGKGNAFLSHIREVDAVAHVVRCFEDDNVVHVDGRVDPAADIETIETELALRDLETVQRRLERARKAAKGQDPLERKAVGLCERLEKVLDAGDPATLVEPGDEDEQRLLRDMFLLTRKPLFYVANIAEDGVGRADDDPRVQRVRELAGPRGRPVVPISAAIEAEIMQLPPEERADFLESVGLREPGLNQVIRTGYEMLDLITFFTAGKPEVHAWTIRRGTRAPQAAGKIHTDFERGFIRAEVIHWKDLVEAGSEAAVKAAGKMAVEGKDYEVKDGDVVHFRFNV
ncbi:MAG: redox-regulated ATPase YchF [Myxococcota bacterium]